MKTQICNHTERAIRNEYYIIMNNNQNNLLGELFTFLISKCLSLLIIII